MHRAACADSPYETEPYRNAAAPHAVIECAPLNSGFLAGAGQKGLISAIIPAFNRQELVCDAIESLASQSYPLIQIIVVDDGSSDRTAQIVRDWAKTHPGRWINLVCQPNRGVSGARNAGLMRAKGEFIYFLDSDDVAEPFTLAMMTETLASAPRSPFALGTVCNTDRDGAIIHGDYSGITHMRGADLLRNHWLLFAALYRREALRRAGPFNESLTMGEDTEINWRVILINGVGVRCNAVLGKRRHHQYGHLYIDSSDTEKMRRSIEMHSALGAWLAERPQFSDRVAARGLWAIHNYYHRLGLNEGEELWAEVAGLFDDLSPASRRTNRLLRWFCQPRNRPLYRQLYRLYRLPRNLWSRFKKLVRARRKAGESSA